MIRLLTLICLFMFAVSHAAEIESILISGCQFGEVNGEYKAAGIENGHTFFIKDSCSISYKGCASKWVLRVGRIQFFKNYTDSQQCPLQNWRPGCGAREKSDTKKIIVPEFEFVFREVLE